MPIEARGKKDPVLAQAIKAGRLPAQAPVYDYVVGRKSLRVGTEVRQPGDPIPEAASWPRLESWLRSGAVEQRPAGSVPQNAAEPQQTATPEAPVPAEEPEKADKPRGGLRPLPNRDMEVTR